MDGLIFDIKELTIHDGPGVRVTVFLKGCPLRCPWCHNPEGQSPAPQSFFRKEGCEGCGKCRIACTHEECLAIGGGRCLKACPKGLLSVCGTTVSAGGLAARLMRYRDILEAGGGGVTVSGGEPLMQPQFLLELIMALKPLHTVVETSGYGSRQAFLDVIGAADLIIFDVKHSDDAMHNKHVGVSNAIIVENLEALVASGKRFIVRIPLIPGFNDTLENMEAIATMLSPAKGGSAAPAPDSDADMAPASDSDADMAPDSDVQAAKGSQAAKGTRVAKGSQAAKDTRVAKGSQPAKGTRAEVELVPYNPFAGAKYACVGREYTFKLSGPCREPAELIRIFESNGIKCKLL